MHYQAIDLKLLGLDGRSIQKIEIIDHKRAISGLLTSMAASFIKSQNYLITSRQHRTQLHHPGCPSEIAIEGIV
jgi:hypothetical protein